MKSQLNIKKRYISLLSGIAMPLAFSYFLLSSHTYAQNWFSMPSFWEVGGPGMAFNIEAFDMNKDGNLDVVVGNWNNTYVYYGGHGILDQVVDVVYTGRMLAICDYNGDGFDDMITMHFTNYDSLRFDYDGELLFYWGSDSTELAIDTIPDYSIPLPTPYPTFERFTVGGFTVGVQKGDLNGDGKTDLVFNSINDVIMPSPGIFNRGKIYIYLGRETPNDSADFILTGQILITPNGDEDYGHFFSVGNINGDAYDDLLISSNVRRTVGVGYDSVNILYVFNGSENFSAIRGNESQVYSSRVNPTDSTADWFIRRFSVDDINGDGIDDLIVGRTFYDKPHSTAVHYGSVNGIDTIPSFKFIRDTTNDGFFSAGGISQNVGDFNDDGYDDFIISPAGYKQFALHFGGPHVSNNNKYGARGHTFANAIYPHKGVNVGDQTNDNVKDIAVISLSAYPDRNGYVTIIYGLRIPTDIKEEIIEIVDFNLLQNYPNPFNSTTIISYQLSVSSNIILKVYDTLGREITTLINKYTEAGKHQIEFNTKEFELSSGVYLIYYNIMGIDGVVKTETKKITLIK